jgi:hypothetical protein
VVRHKQLLPSSSRRLIAPVKAGVTGIHLSTRAGARG